MHMSERFWEVFGGRIVTRGHLVAFAIFVIGVPAVAFGLSQAQDKKYTASSALLFEDPGFDQRIFGGLGDPPSADPSQQTTNLRLVTIRPVAERAASKLNNRVSVSDLRAMVNVQAEGESSIVRLDATAKDPRFAARVANVFAEQYIEYRRGAERAKLARAQEMLTREVAQRRDRALPTRELDERIDQLRTLAALQSGDAELVERASAPTSPSTPQTRRNTLLGIVLGLLLGISAVVILQRFDRRLVSVHEVNGILGVPLIGSTPHSSPRASAAENTPLSGASDGLLPEFHLESFRMLRANLRYFHVHRELQSLAIVSATSDEGKSTASLGLALAAASMGARVLLVDTDLRQSRLDTTLDVVGRDGLAQHLSGHLAADAMVSTYWRADQQQEGADGPRLDVILAGGRPPNPGALLESTRMPALIADMRERYDLLIVDTAPLTLVADAIPLLDHVDGVVAVVRFGVTMRASAATLAEQLRHLDAPVVGWFANGASQNDGYGYGYGRPADAGDRESEQPTDPAHS